MIISIDISAQDEIRINELKKALELSNRSDIIRQAIRFYHKNFLPTLLTTYSALKTMDSQASSFAKNKGANP